MKRVVRAWFKDNYGTVVFEDGTEQQMTRDEYLLMERNYNPSSVAKLIKFIQNKGAFYDAGHRRPLTRVCTKSPYEFFHGKDLVTRTEYEKIMKLIARYQRFRNYVEEIAPEWRTIDTIYWADNSIEDIQVNKYGERRKVTRVGPWGDVCF